MGTVYHGSGAYERLLQVPPRRRPQEVQGEMWCVDCWRSIGRLGERPKFADGELVLIQQQAAVV